MSETALNFALHPAQLEVFNDPHRFTVLTAGRRFGKTHLAGTRASVKALDPLNVKKKPVFIIAPIATQAKLLYWQWLLDNLHPVIENYQSNEGHIYLKNGVMIGVKGSDRPDTLRGVGLWHAELDEFADMKIETWDAIIRPALTDVKGTAGFIGTPKGRNHFYDLFKYADEGRDGVLDPEWAAFHYTSMDNPFLDPAEIEKARNSMPGWLFRQEFLASFETGGSGSFLREWCKYVDEELKDDKGRPLDGDWCVVVDLAGFAAVEKAAGYKQRRLDQTSIAVVKVYDDERWFVRDIYAGRWGVQETAKRIVDAVESCKTMHLGIEKGALYNAVAPALQDEAFKRKLHLNVVPLSHENRSKPERIGWALQGRMEHGKILLRRAPWNREFEDQLVHFPSSLVHDDMLDSLAYVVQLMAGQVFQKFAELQDEPYWEPEDRLTGY